MEEWRFLLGGEFTVARSLLRPTSHRVDVYPCPSPGGDGCPRQVVDLGAHGLHAVCRDVERGCRDIPLKPEDIVVHELDRRRLGVLAAMAVGVTPVTCAPVASMRETYHIGEHNPRAGDRFPVFLTIQPDRMHLRDVLTRLHRAEVVPFMVLVPTDHGVDPDLRELFTGKKSQIIALGDILAIEEPATLVPTPAAARMLEEFHSGIFPDDGQVGAMERFPTTPNAHWNEIKIRFLDRDTVSIQCQGVVRTSTYLYMKMADTRTGKPNKQWMLLYAMADDRGRMDIWSLHVSRLNKKRKENLSKSLRGYFGIADDPIFWDDEASAYLTRFTLEPES